MTRPQYYANRTIILPKNGSHFAKRRLATSHNAMPTVQKLPLQHTKYFLVCKKVGYIFLASTLQN
jgi:hypothetical protein